MVIDAWRDQVRVVGLPEADMHVHGGREGRHLHVVGPLAWLSHLLDMVFELLLQLLFRVIGGVDAGERRSRGLAFGVAADMVDGHVLAVEVCVGLHVLDGGSAEHLVHLLVAVQLVGQGVEQAVALQRQLEKRVGGE